eukprot:scaffold8135_cov127-Skeletonema_dohrnii-CCMP3373.AAC.2
MAKNPSRKSRSKKVAAKKSSTASIAKKRITKIGYLDKANAKLKAAHDNRERDYAAEIKRLDDKEEELLIRLSKLEEQKEKVATEHGEAEDVSDDDLIEINAGGKIIAAKRGTLCQLKGTRLEALFSGRWDKKLQRDSSGRIFLDVNGDCFQAIVDYLNELAISSDEDPPAYTTVGGENRRTLHDHLQLFGLPLSTLVSESNIIKDLSQAESIEHWLQEDGSAGPMKLLYRSSRDGLSSEAFHDKCDDNNSGDNVHTLVVIETKEGGIVGGYSNTPWDCCNGNYIGADKAFLFVLSGFNIQSPCKMKLKDKDDTNAILNDKNCGPVFGGGQDLYVVGSYVNLLTGCTYQEGPTEELNGGSEYEINEMEVFQISDLSGKQRKQLSSGSEKKVASVDRFTGEVNNAINDKWLTLQELEEEVFSLEESFKDEETFIDSFVSGDTSDVVMLNVSGTMMATKRDVLMFAEDSVLAQQFDDTKWTEQGCKDMRVTDWEPDDVMKWVKKIKDVPNNVAQLFIENEITGSELLALNENGLKMLGVKRVGTICLLFDEISALKKTSSEDTVTLIEHSPYCFGKILDYLRMKYLHSIELIDNEPALPTVCDDQKKRFAKVVKYYFPGESSSFVLG